MVKRICCGAYVAPILMDLHINVERGFAISDSSFEQPEFGGEDNL